MQTRTKRLACFLSGAILLLAACGTYKAYPGPERQRIEIAIIIGDFRIRANSPVGVFLRKVNGVVIPQYNSRVALLPGEHVLLVDCFLHQPDNLTRHEIKVQVEAGQRYRFQPIFATGNRDCDSVKLVAEGS